MVLQADVRLIERRSRDDATGEVLSLQGKLQGTKMGDRYQRTKPALAEERKAKRQKRDEATTSVYKLKQSSLFDDEFIGGDIGGGAILYRPKTQETRQTYDVLLNFIQVAIGDQPRDVLCGAADEILAVLKNDRLKDKDRKKEVENLLGPMPEERFALLVNLGKKITDFQVKSTTGASGEGDIDDTYGINVQFEESEEEDDQVEFGEVNDEDEEEDMEGVEATENSAIQAQNVSHLIVLSHLGCLLGSAE